MSTQNTAAPKEQLLYGTMLFYGCWSGLLIMLLTYLIYCFGVLDPHVGMQDVTRLWSMPVGEYLSQAGVPVGWGWATLLNRGDFLNFIGIAFLAGLTIICYIPLIGAYLKKKDPIFAILAVAEIIVLSVAASGLVGSGGH
ncbi:DUF1634 domain-containing protein [Desulfovibrio aminophilus]|nr:DUF1634 domain-containing protein [Desulfovibrio aminophilus]MCM0755787.1 DUF1634 domain-containing protein [Desulfovibrio aminophilus]